MPDNGDWHPGPQGRIEFWSGCRKIVRDIAVKSIPKTSNIKTTEGLALGSLELTAALSGACGRAGPVIAGINSLIRTCYGHWTILGSVDGARSNTPTPTSVAAELRTFPADMDIRMSDI